MKYVFKKKKRLSAIKKKKLVEELHHLAVNSLNFNIDLQSASEDFKMMINSMEERQSELYARSVGLNEKYG